MKLLWRDNIAIKNKTVIRHVYCHVSAKCKLTKRFVIIVAKQDDNQL